MSDVNFGAYSDLKVAWHLDRIAQLRDSGRCPPAQIQLVLSDLCNQDCGFCAYRMSGYSSNQHFPLVRPDGVVERNPNRMIPEWKALEIVEDARRIGCSAIQFTGGGEPTVHPEHLHVFAHALDHGLRCALVTNGVLLRSGWDDVLPNFDWIRVSLDAGDPRVYSEVRKAGGTVFWKVLENISKLAGAGIAPGTSFVVTRENWETIEDAAKHAREAGAASIRYAAVFSPEMADRYPLEWARQVQDRIGLAVQKWASHEFKVIDLFGQRLGDLKTGRPDFGVCSYQQLNVYIGGDQKVYRCCNTAYNDLGYVGDIASMRFADWFLSEEAAKAYADFNPRKCEHCAFHGKNAVLAYLREKEPEGVEFA